MRRVSLVAWAVALGASALLVDCDMLGEGSMLGNVSLAACPELSAQVDAFGTTYASNPTINGKVRAFVQASKDLMAVSAQAEAEATEACTRIGYDIGLSPAQMAARKEAGGRASGACNAVAAAMDSILQSGLRFSASVTAPVCQASGDAYGRCSGGCQTAADSECNASCRAHANLTASCTPASVRVMASANTQLSARLVNSLQANLPLLLHAEMALGKRVVSDADAMVQVGRALPNIIGNAGTHAVACVASAGNMSVQASASIKVSVQASANVSARAGAGG